ncbi:UL16-binding protein 1 isoform X2 [Cricetulus griseus]|uniref:UL16-binding protein 1 isoform X2 n=1 Tax=Cricetulus griseus TaxID=10029 RepID=A0A9J7GP47_CRIGR|nr:UL16-binding protein 1 isoform X2 [Cricetulus griseus]
MKWVAGIRFLVWSMLTWVLPVGECALSPSDAASLCYIFTVGKSGSGPWQHKVQGQLNEETFLSYNSINNCHVFGVLGIRLNATKICDKQVDTLKDGADLIKQQVIRMNNIIREPLTLQAKMHCWHDGDGHFNASWDIGLNGQKILHFDSSTGKLTEVGPGSSWIKELWEEDRHVTAFLTVTSQGDCRSWLQEVTLHLGKKLQPTESLLLFISPDPPSLTPSSQDIHPHDSSPAASPTATPHVDQPPSSLAIKPNISVLLIILPYTLLCFPRGTLDNDRVKMLQRM